MLTRGVKMSKKTSLASGCLLWREAIPAFNRLLYICAPRFAAIEQDDPPVSLADGSHPNATVLRTPNCLAPSAYNCFTDLYLICLGAWCSLLPLRKIVF